MQTSDTRMMGTLACELPNADGRAPSAEDDPNSRNSTMHSEGVDLAGKPEGRGTPESRAQAALQQARNRRKAARKDLCALATVEVRKNEKGYRVMIKGGDNGRRKFVIVPSDVERITRDLETAIRFMREER